MFLLIPRQQLAVALELTETQQEQVRALYVEKYNRKQASKAAQLSTKEVNKADKKVIKAERKADKQEYKASFDARMNAILTPEQIEKRNTLETKRSETRKANKGQKGKHRKMNKADKKPRKMNKLALSTEQIQEKAQKATDRMTKRLDLNSDQQSLVKEAHVKHYTAIVDLSSRQDVNRENLNEERVAIGSEFKNNIDSILTDEQKEKREARKNTRKNKKRQHK